MCFSFDKHYETPRATWATSWGHLVSTPLPFLGVRGLQDHLIQKQTLLELELIMLEAIKSACKNSQMLLEVGDSCYQQTAPLPLVIGQPLTHWAAARETHISILNSGSASQQS